MVNIKKFIILSMIYILAGCSTLNIPTAAQEVIAATEAHDYGNYMEWRYRDQWILLNPDVYESQNIYIKLDNSKVIPNSNGKEIIRVWNKMIMTKESHIKFAKVTDYFINYDEFDCANGTVKTIEFHLYDGKTNNLILSQRGLGDTQKVIPSSNSYLVYNRACEYRNLYLKYQK